MKRYLLTITLAFTTLCSLMSQNIETPTCFAFLSEPNSTLKYKFSYQESNFFTCLRLIKGSESVFEDGDIITMETKDGTSLKFQITEDKLKDMNSGYIHFITSESELSSLKKGMNTIMLHRNGTTFPFKLDDYQNSCSKKNAQMIIENAYKTDKINEQKKIIAEQKELIAEQKEKLSAKRELTKLEKELGIKPSKYNRLYLGYAPFYYQDGYYEDLNIGFTRGVRLGKKENIPFIQYGVQFDWGIGHEGEKDEFSFTFPIDITQRYYLGKSNVSISPFVGALFKINVRHSTSDYELFQPGLEFGFNIDYKHFYTGILYHTEFFTKKGLGHTRGLSVRIGLSF